MTPFDKPALVALPGDYAVLVGGNVVEIRRADGTVVAAMALHVFRKLRDIGNGDAQEERL